MQVRIRKLVSEAVIPRYAKAGDAAMDLVATSENYEPGIFAEYGTGLSMEIPEGYVGLLFPRSSISNKALILSNSVGVIDSGYRGEIKFRFYEAHKSRKEYNIGDRIGQIMIIPYPTIEFVETTELSNTDRGTGGYGSTGN